MRLTGFLATVFIGGCLVSGAEAADKIRILSPTWPGYAPVWVADDLGYFKADGIEIEYKFEDDRANVMAAMARGDIDMDMRTVGEHQGRPRDEKTPGVIIGTIDKSLGGDGVIAEGSIKSVKDLKGKTIAAEQNIPARLLLQMALKQNGMSLKDMKVKEIATADTVAVFADKGVAAVASYEPFMSQALKTDAARKGKMLLSSKDSELIIDIIVVRQEELKANPEKYVKFLKSVYKAVDFYKQKPAEFIKLAAPHYNLSEAEVKETLDGSLVYTDLAESAKLIGAPGKPGTLYGIFDTVMQLNLDLGAADTKLNAASQIDPSIMAKVTGAK